VSFGGPIRVDLIGAGKREGLVDYSRITTAQKGRMFNAIYEVALPIGLESAHFPDPADISTVFIFYHTIGVEHIGSLQGMVTKSLLGVGSLGKTRESCDYECNRHEKRKQLSVDDGSPFISYLFCPGTALVAGSRLNSFASR
jgi:hypothetical protein